ncbi:hypothetical protein HOD61_02295 [archaeon]|jgi:hypothetical protein|nr:hypothetical protein [archaeon]
MGIEKIICETKEKYKENITRLNNEGWKLEKVAEDYAKFKNNFPILIETTAYMRIFSLPDYTEVYYKPKQEE